jgi:hypothetical protein
MLRRKFDRWKMAGRKASCPTHVEKNMMKIPFLMLGFACIGGPVLDVRGPRLPARQRGLSG